MATDEAGNTTTTAAVTATVDTTATVIESFGSTSLTEIANHYYLYNSSGSGPSLKYLGADFVAYNAWAPIGAEQTASGYEVAWKYAGADLYTVWNTDSSGNFVSDTIGAVSGASSVLKSLETSFQQDLNGDGTIGLASAVISGNADTFVFNLSAKAQPSVTDLTHAADPLDISSRAASPHPGIEDYFAAGNAGAPPVDLIAGGDGHAPAFAVHHHPTDFHLI